MWVLSIRSLAWRWYRMLSFCVLVWVRTQQPYSQIFFLASVCSLHSSWLECFSRNFHVYGVWLSHQDCWCTSVVSIVPCPAAVSDLSLLPLSAFYTAAARFSFYEPHGPPHLYGALGLAVGSVFETFLASCGAYSCLSAQREVPHGSMLTASWYGC